MLLSVSLFLVPALALLRATWPAVLTPLVLRAQDSKLIETFQGPCAIVPFVCRACGNIVCVSQVAHENISGGKKTIFDS
jgi:hypothetical protein